MRYAAAQVAANRNPLVGHGFPTCLPKSGYRRSGLQSATKLSSARIQTRRRSCRCGIIPDCNPCVKYDLARPNDLR